MDVAANLQRVRERIARACERSHRAPQDILLVAVTKSVGIPGIKAGLASGLTHLGENRIQEALDKMDCLEECRRDITWHLVGRLQANKARKAAQQFDMVHSLDSIALAKTLDRLAQAPLDVLLQVNVAGEATKAGLAPADVGRAARAVARLPRLRLKGLMTIAPAVADPEWVRMVFRRLREMRDALGLEHLSMGMTDDFEVAIEEGATILRIGRAIFGGTALAPRDEIDTGGTR